MNNRLIKSFASAHKNGGCCRKHSVLQEYVICHRPIFTFQRGIRYLMSKVSVLKVHIYGLAILYQMHYCSSLKSDFNSPSASYSSGLLTSAFQRWNIHKNIWLKFYRGKVEASKTVGDTTNKFCAHTHTHTAQIICIRKITSHSSLVY